MVLEFLAGPARDLLRADWILCCSFNVRLVNQPLKMKTIVHHIENGTILDEPQGGLWEFESKLLPTRVGIGGHHQED